MNARVFETPRPVPGAGDFDSAAVPGAAYDAVGLTVETSLPGVRASVVCRYDSAPSHDELRRHVDTLTLLGPAVAASTAARVNACNVVLLVTVFIVSILLFVL